MRRFAILAITILFMLTACMPIKHIAASMDEHTAMSTTVLTTPLTASSAPALCTPVASAPVPMITAEPTKTPFSLWKQSDVYTGWALKKQTGIERESAPASVPDSVLRMLPVIEFILDFRTSYDFHYDDLSYFESFVATNQHTLNNEAYLWALMANLFKCYGLEHPEVTIENGLITVPESAAQDFLNLCFIDYTEQFVLPKKMPERYKNSALPGCFENPEQYMLYSSDAYTLKQALQPPFFTGSSTQYVITRCEALTNEVYGLDIIKLYGPDDYDTAIFRVELTSSQKDIFGLEWRISRIIRVDGIDTTHAE